MAFDEASAEVDAALGKIAALDPEGLSTAKCAQLLERMETWARRVPALQHGLINQVREHATVEDVGGKISHALANWLRIRRCEARRRIEEAIDLAPRRAFTGEPLAPVLEHAAAAQQQGAIGVEHVRVIRAFLARLPCCVDEPSREWAEQQLVWVGTQYRPDELGAPPPIWRCCLTPMAIFLMRIARRRGITVGPQGPDGMSRISGHLTSELRAGLDAVLAKLAAPGMCNPADEDPTITGTL